MTICSGGKVVSICKAFLGSSSVANWSAKRSADIKWFFLPFKRCLSNPCNSYVGMQFDKEVVAQAGVSKEGLKLCDLHY